MRNFSTKFLTRDRPLHPFLFAAIMSMLITLKQKEVFFSLLTYFYPEVTEKLILKSIFI